MRLWAFALFLSVAFAGGLALAQNAPKPLGETLGGDAKAAYESGKLLFGDGDYAGAEIKFKAAYDASHDARLLWNMAACEKSQRHYARTEQLVRQYLDEAGAQLTQQDKDSAKALLDLIESFTVKLTISVSEPGAEVLVDDVSVGKTPLAKPVVVDIGSRKITVKKDGFKDFEQQVPVGGSATAKLDVKLAPEVHEGRVSIVTQPNADIFLDGVHVARGRYDAKVKSGGHTLRVVAEGMQPYQSEIVISDEELRRIDVPLEAQARAVPEQKPKPWAPGGEAALSTGPGIKFHNSGAALYDLRLEIGWKPGWPTELALTVDLGSIDASGNCAFDVHGPTPTSPTDIEARYSLQSCLFVKPGLEFAYHVLPKKRIDPYIAIEGGFRFQFATFKYYDPLGTPAPTTLADNGPFLPGIDVGGRIGVDWAPLATHERWRVGGFVSVLFVTDDEAGGGNGCCSGPSTNQHTGPAQYPWLILGARTSLIF